MDLKFTYRQKIKLLPLALILILIIIYGVAIKDVVSLHHDCIGLMDQISQTKDAPQEMASTERQLNEITQITGKVADPRDTDPLLEFISEADIKNAVQLVEYQPVHQFQSQHYRIETRIACFEGSFSHLLELLYQMEKQFKAGKVVSVKYQTELNFKTNKRRLLMTLYIQSISNNKDNTKMNQNAG